jgi:hypothetical protein
VADHRDEPLPVRGAVRTATSVEAVAQMNINKTNSRTLAAR